MKIQKYLCIALSAFALTACDQDFAEGLYQAANSQDDKVSFGKGSVAEQGVIDFAALADDLASVKIAGITAPTSSDTTYTSTYRVKFADNTTFDVDTDGNMSRTDLEEYVNKLYGKRPTERQTKAVLVATVSNGATATRIESDTFLVKTIAEAPVIEEAYYMTGSMNSWSNTNTDYLVTNGGGDVYDNPVFTITFDAPAGTDNIEFKLTPKSGIGGDWSKCITADKEGAEGKLAEGNVGGNLVIPYTAGAVKYRATFNMLDQTWSYEALSFNEFIYEVGNNTGWGDSPYAMYGPNFDGKYYGAFYLNGEFKFKPNPGGDWNGDWEQKGEGKLDANGDGNIPAPGTGFYFVTVDVAALTYTLVPFSEMHVVGDALAGNADQWGAGVAMTYNQADKTWTANGVQLDGGKSIKFKDNDSSWGGVNLGGALDKLVQGSNDNIAVGTSGKYNIVLHLENTDRAPYAELQPAQ